MAYGEAARGPGARQPDQVLAADVDREQARPDREPRHVPPGQEVIRAFVLLAAERPVADAQGGEEVQRDEEEVEPPERLHGGFPGPRRPARGGRTGGTVGFRGRAEPTSSDHRHLILERSLACGPTLKRRGRRVPGDAVWIQPSRRSFPEIFSLRPGLV